MLRDAKQRREEWIFFKIKEGDQFLGSFSPRRVSSSSSFQVERRRTLHKKDFREECKRAYLRHAPNANCLSFTTFAQPLLVRLRCLTEKDLEEELELIAKKKCQEVCSMLGIRPGKVGQHVPACVSWGTRHFTTGISLFSPLKLLMLSNHEIQFWTHPLFEYWGFKGLFPAVRMLTFQPSR